MFLTLSYLQLTLPLPIHILINKELHERFKANKLSVNASKTNYMQLNTNHKLSRLDENASIILENTDLERITNKY